MVLKRNDHNLDGTEKKHVKQRGKVYKENLMNAIQVCHDSCAYVEPI